MSRVSDLFKSPNEDRPKAKHNIDYYNRSIHNSYGINVSNNHRPTEQSDLKKLMNSGLTECKVINNRNEGVAISISGCNRIEKIEINNELSLRYEDCKKVEETTDSKYSMHIRNGYKVYNLYKYNFVANRETIHMVIITK